MNRLTKKYSMALAALLILLYHCWINVFRYGSVLGNIERFIVTSSFVGVDIFFFVSAYSLSTRPPEDYVSFILNRALKLMPLFIIAYALGTFLWFLPSLMIVYLIFPLVYNKCKQNPGISFMLLMLAWAVVTWLVLGVLKPEQDYGIFLFRIPVIILGAYAPYVSKSMLTTKKQRAVLGTLFLVFGTAVVYIWGYIERINIPFKGTFYLTCIPQLIGIMLLLGLIEKESKIINYFASMTLELYFVQMVTGNWLINNVYKLSGSRILTNLITLGVVILLSKAISLIGETINDTPKKIATNERG